MIHLRELKERKLVQWALAYLAAAWLLLQLAGLLSDAYGWSPLIMQAMPVLLVMGFFGALVLAWYHGEKGRQRVGTVELGMLVGILVLAGVGVAWVAGEPEAAEGEMAEGDDAVASTDSLLAPIAEAEQGSIAVLPFVNMSSDEEQEYFSDGITEELLNVLAQLPELRVAARTSAFSFKGKDVAIDSVARALNVRHVLEGSVRKSGEQVRITAQLIDARTGYHVWSHTYDRQVGDIFAVQDEISRAIVDQLQIRLSGREGPLARIQTSDPEAHQLALRARQMVLGGTQFPAAERLYEEAIARDSGYAAAWAGLANVHRVQAQEGLIPLEAGLERARSEAERALALNPEESDAQLVLGTVEMISGRSSAAGTHFERALRTNPGDARTLALYAHWLIIEGRAEEARRFTQRAEELDPLSVAAIQTSGNLSRMTGDLEGAARSYERALALAPDNLLVLGELGFARVLLGERTEAIRLAERLLENSPHSPEQTAVAGWIHAYARDFDRAVELFRRTIELDPEKTHGRAYLANALVMIGEDEEARRVADRALELAPDDHYVRTIHAYVHAKTGRRAAAERSLRHIPDDQPAFRAAVWANLGDEDRAFALLERAAEARDPGLAELGVDWWYDALRDDPRMDRLLERVGVPEVATRY